MRLKTKHSLSDCIYWNLLALLPLFTACLSLARYSLFWMGFYILIFLFQFLVVTYRFFCSHCPHYCNDSKTTKCMFLWGIPKFFKKRPRELNKSDLSIMFLGLIITVLFPVYWLIKIPPLLIIYLLSWCIFILTLKRYECGRCIYSQCPLNTADKNRHAE